MSKAKQSEAKQGQSQSLPDTQTTARPTKRPLRLAPLCEPPPSDIRSRLSTLFSHANSLLYSSLRDTYSSRHHEFRHLTHSRSPSPTRSQPVYDPPVSSRSHPSRSTIRLCSSHATRQSLLLDPTLSSAGPGITCLRTPPQRWRLANVSEPHPPTSKRPNQVPLASAASALVTRGPLLHAIRL